MDGIWNEMLKEAIIVEAKMIAGEEVFKCKNPATDFTCPRCRAKNNFGGGIQALCAGRQPANCPLLFTLDESKATVYCTALES